MSSLPVFSHRRGLYPSVSQELSMFYLICYDVTHDRRRDRVSRLLEGYGLRVQKSVFECVLTPDQHELLQQRLQTKRYLNPDEDQIRFYPMSPRHRQMILILGVQPQRQIDDSVFIV